MTRAHRSRLWACLSVQAGLTLALIFAAAAPAAVLAPSAGQGLPSSVLTEGPGRALRDGDRVLAYVRFDQGALAGLDRLRMAGAKIVDASRRYQTITVAARPGELDELEAIPRVADVALARRPIVAKAGTATPVASSVQPCFGAATSEGDLQLEAMAARDGFEVDGREVKVGILSDSFNRDGSADTGKAEDIASGDLPGPGNPCGFTTPVQVLDDSIASGEDEGRAMAQIMHDLAPGASLAFATAFGGELDFAKNIKKLAEAGASVIVDDVFYPEEPFFQDGPVAVAVREAVEGGAIYLSAAGNDNLIGSGGSDIASWEAPQFRDSGSCPAPVVALSEEVEAAEGPGSGLNPEHCMDFDPGAETDTTFGIVVSKGATLLADLQWAEPRDGVESDLDAFLLNSAEEPIEATLRDNASSGGTQEPLEEVEWENNTGSAALVKLVINRYSGTLATPLKFALLENGSGVTATEYPESTGEDTVGPTIFGHSGSASAVSVAAAPFFDSERPELYSSRGPVTHYFGPVSGTEPAEPLASPEVIAKPDVTATDGGANTFFGACESHTWRFYGTSAAAPHAAAVAALELQAEPGASASQVRDALTETASPMDAFDPEAVGSGLVNAPGALAQVTSVPFPGGTQFAQQVPQNCGFPSSGATAPPATIPSPVGPAPVSASPKRHGPRTFIRRHPSRIVHTHHRRARVVFRFGSNEVGVSYACRVDGGLFRTCPTRFSWRFPIGRHTVRVAARDAEGNGDKTPAVYRFRVKRAGH